MWEEIIRSILLHKTKSFFTGLGVFWGIFILILLLGMGNGLEKGIYVLFKGFSQTTVYVYTGQSNANNRGDVKGILFDEYKLRQFKNSVPDIEYISPEISRFCQVTNNRREDYYEVRGVLPDYFNIKYLKVSQGRLIDYLDDRDKRKMILIGSQIAEVFFGKKSPLDKTLEIDGQYYLVVGVIKNNIFNQFESRVVYMPYNSFSDAYPAIARFFNTLILSLQPGSDIKRDTKKLKETISWWYKISPADTQSLYVNSLEDQVKAFNELFGAIRKFLWFMGLSTLLSGLLGVSNIMYMSAKERTREIGIRKAVGAKKTQLIRAFVSESLFLTAVAGIFGMITGILVLQLIGTYIEGNGQTLFEKPEADLVASLSALAILMLGGIVSGIKPALYAASINPIDAVRHE